MWNRITAPATNQVNRDIGQGDIVQHQQMSIEKSANFLGSGGRYASANRLQLLACHFQTVKKALHLVLDDAIGDGVFGDLQLVALK